MILAGAALMLASLLKWRSLSRVTPYIPERSRAQTNMYLRVHGLLMALFLLGYIIVAIAFIFGITSLGEMIVGGVFLGGAIFVFLGIVIQLRMLAEIQATIRGLLPLCSNCKRVRYDGGDPGAQESPVRRNHGEISRHISASAPRRTSPTASAPNAGRSFTLTSSPESRP
jgi:hypothetical protein